MNRDHEENEDGGRGLLATRPIGVIIFPGSGIPDNLADKARELGSRFGGSQAAHERCPQVVVDAALTDATNVRERRSDRPGRLGTAGIPTPATGVTVAAVKERA